MTKLTENFTIEDFKCKCGTECGAKIWLPLVLSLQAMRTEYNRPIVITSGARCPDWNLKQGGKPGSLHLQGKAVDVAVSSDLERFELLRLALVHSFRGIGLGPNFLHLDMRPTPAIWLYPPKK